MPKSTKKVIRNIKCNKCDKNAKITVWKSHDNTGHYICIKCIHCHNFEFWFDGLDI